MAKSASVFMVVALASFTLCPGAEAANPRLVHAVPLGDHVLAAVKPTAPRPAPKEVPAPRAATRKKVEPADPFAPASRSKKEAEPGDPFTPLGPPQPAKAPSVGADLPAGMAKAVAAFGKGDFYDALQAMETLVESQPELRPAELLMEKLAASAREQAAKRQEFEWDIGFERRVPEAYAGLAELALNGGRLVEAEVLYAKARDLADVLRGEPERKKVVVHQSLSGLAAVAESRHRYEEARQWLRALLAIDPDDSDALRRFGRAQLLQEQEEEEREAARPAPPEPAPEVRMPELIE